MSTRSSRSAGWAAYFSGIAAILGLVSLILFFSLESAPNSAQSPHFWGPVSDIAPILQMLPLLVVLFSFYRMQRTNSAKLSWVGISIGILGMLGVILLQLLLIIKVISFEQEVLPVLVATAAVGLWLILVNDIGRRQGNLPTGLAWLGMAVGAAFILEPLLLSAAGGAVAWRVFMSNYFLLAGSAVVFLVSYVGFPIWAFWLGQVFLRKKKEGSIMAKISRYVYLCAAWLFLTGVVTQVFLAGMVVVAGKMGWNDHVGLGHALSGPLLVMLVSLYLGRLPRSMKWMTWLLFGVYILQADVVIFLRLQAPVIAALHPVLALADFALGLSLARRVWPLAKQIHAPTTVQPDAQTTAINPGNMVSHQ